MKRENLSFQIPILHVYLQRRGGLASWRHRQQRPAIPKADPCSCRRQPGLRDHPRRTAGTIPPRCVSKNRMEPWPLPKARPISCNDSPAFQRRHMSARCSAESLSRFPCAMNTTFKKIIPMRWCCIDRLRPPGFAASSRSKFLKTPFELL